MFLQLQQGNLWEDEFTRAVKSCGAVRMQKTPCLVFSVAHELLFPPDVKKLSASILGMFKAKVFSGEE